MNPNFKFETAQRVQLKASIMIEGLTGSGKSGLALLLALYLAGKWEDVAVTDTENKSANLFAGLPFSNGNPVGGFKVVQLTKDIGYAPSNYLACRRAAIEMGAKVNIKDSISHAWQYAGGVLEKVNAAAAKTRSNDKYAAWRDPEVADEKMKLMELIRDPDIHVITTVRVKEKFEYVAGDDGKNKLQSLGEQQIQQADLKYEPDLVLHMVRPGSKTLPPKAEVVKSRYAILTKGETYEFTPELCLQIKAYVEEGADPQELLEAQRVEYINAITEFLDANTSARSIWSIIKSDAGFKDTKLSDIPLDSLKRLYNQMTT